MNETGPDEYMRESVDAQKKLLEEQITGSNSAYISMIGICVHWVTELSTLMGNRSQDLTDEENQALMNLTILTMAYREVITEKRFNNIRVEQREQKCKKAIQKFLEETDDDINARDPVMYLRDYAKAKKKLAKVIQYPAKS